MSTYFVTGATGSPGRGPVAGLQRRPDCERAFALVRPRSADRLERHHEPTPVLDAPTSTFDPDRGARERRSGHVSGAGLRITTPRSSPHPAPKSELDAFSRVAASETVARGVTFTSVRMPLVRTPVIGPTKVYDAFPATPPERGSPTAEVAAGLARPVLRAAR
ncbi:hypothetical protein AB0G02_04350 [Actinosynnema sp. NPDC023658]|uniref:hypothetical protein n=1 Tax=Actinosynnema sp. NPDC023658 TaxID=3155465 RepID=UPI0033F254D7